MIKRILNYRPEEKQKQEQKKMQKNHNKTNKKTMKNISNMDLISFPEEATPEAAQPILTPSQKRKLLWDQFDETFSPSSTNNDNSKKIECVFNSNTTSKDSAREFCDDCKSILFLSDEGFPTCSNNKCGIIYKDIVDQSAEWRFYGADDNQGSDPTRCGMPINPLLKESSFGCKVLCSGSTTFEMRKIRRYTEWQAFPYSEKTQYEKFQQITVMAQIAGMPKLIIDDALRWHKKLCEYEQKYRSENKDGLIIGSVYLSCRENNYPRTAKELAAIFHRDPAVATHGCKLALFIINDMEKNLDDQEKTLFCKTTPDAFIERFCSRLNINGELTKLCLFIAYKIEKDNLMPENTPHSIAASIVYFVAQICKLSINKQDVKKICDISEVTINKCYKKLERMLDKLIPQAILKKYSTHCTNIAIVNCK